jgi:hypothetical protein
VVKHRDGAQPVGFTVGTQLQKGRDLQGHGKITLEGITKGIIKGIMEGMIKGIITGLPLHGFVVQSPSL